MSFPSHARKVFTGEIFDVYQWEQVVYDGTTKIFEGLSRDHAVQIIATGNEMVYIGKQEQPHLDHPFYCIFGGRIDPGEAPLAAAKRELREESGLTSIDWSLYRTISPYSKMDFLVHIYIAKHCTRGGDQQLDGGEKIDVLEVTFDDFFDIVRRDDFFGREIQVDLLKRHIDDPSLQSFRTLIF